MNYLEKKPTGKVGFMSLTHNRTSDRVDCNRIRNALLSIPAQDRATWVKIGMAIHSELGEAGFDLWDTWSQSADSYKTRDARTVWKSFKSGGATTIGSLFHEAKRHGWRDTNTNNRYTTNYLKPKEVIQHQVERVIAEETEIAQERASTALKATAIWEQASEAKADHPYLVRKQISPIGTLREIDASAISSVLNYSPKSDGQALTGRLLIVPVYQSKQLSTLELIDEHGRKTALAGRGSKTGGYWPTIYPLPTSVDQILIGEGVATVLSAQQAMGGALGIASLSSGNLCQAAKQIRQYYPEADLVVLADLVKTTGEPDPHAIEAARLVNGKLAIPNFGKDRPADQTDFNDLAALSGIEAVREAIDGARIPTQEGKSWNSPQPLTAQIYSEPYPIDVLPDTIRAAVEEVAGFVQAPLALVASSALAAISLATQAHVNVQRAEKLQGPVGLFLLTIADSGERKSTCDSFFTSAIRQYQADQAVELKPEVDRYHANLATWTAQREGLLLAIKEASKKGKPKDTQQDQLIELERIKPLAPKMPRLLIGDETPEHLAWSLAKEWPSAGMISSEAGLIFGAHGMGKDSVMRNLALINTLWDGGSHSIGRRTSESFVVDGARLTVALQVQEATLRSFMEKSGELARGTGFLARFLIAWPESTQGTRFYKEPPKHWPHLARFDQRIATLLTTPVMFDDQGVLSPDLIVLTPEAKEAWIRFHDTIERELTSSGELHDVRDVASKAADNVTRLATLFQRFEWGLDRGAVIGPDYIHCASQIVAWHLNESRRFFRELSLPTELIKSKKLDSWLTNYCQEKQIDFVYKNDVLQRGPLRNSRDLDTAIEELVDLNRLQFAQEGKRSVLQLNPSLLEVAA